ncbi:NAD(P)/FAD-dependent oxidoreductase [Roseomonas indoligenes]|uniref:NAD(P)/FAD-dependent oxidoreductase n=1 Tax=Roseomonas indoligenes TaxID=2820811 RepID=A0A940S525_9PROT|nr:NAD(P)/FAD-dependent oxidoreductase [Pararoseomonas indoligenes]MBP0493946.1 NAD(P)/FAD-dependent oxidoreductase [Pararoseomonas indoligenes]
MLRLTEIKLPLDHEPDALRDAVLARLRVAPEEVLDITVFRRGHDARRRGAIALIYTLDVALRDEAAVLARLTGERHVAPTPETSYRLPPAPPVPRLRPVVIGAGPCGLFAMLVLAQLGLRPILIERGKVVRERTQDTWGLWRRSVLTPESNVQFGEGGAGTFSDGKLYSGIGDNANRIRKVLEEFVAAGAPEEILYLSKPHIGTFRLVSMVEKMRAGIEALGGEYRFGTRVEDIELGPDRALRGLHLSDGSFLEADRAVLAIGHSARDTFGVLHDRGVFMEAKPFSIGVRIEHPQGLIDRCRFGPQAGHPVLGAADYKIVHHCKTPAAEGRAVYSFCMCPGGQVVAAASEPGRLVTNGMSQYSRAERNANAGIVVSLTPERDYPGSPLAGLAFQRHWEERAFVAGGSNWNAPVQRVEDFLAARPSTRLGEVIPSYKPGVTPTDLAACLPDFAAAAIREALPAFDRQIRGFAMGDAVMTGVETRTSSPLRIRRDETGQSLNTPGLFPAGEGAGYAGGILSAGVDGIRAAEAVAASLSAIPLVA